MFLGRVRIPTLSDATNEFDVRVGFTEFLAVPLDEACWVYDRNVSTDWQVSVKNNGTQTINTVTGFTVDTSGAGSVVTLGVFVNGDGTRVEFFYSADEGVTWTVFGTATTTNIPTTRNTSMGVSILKSAGTTARTMRVIFAGQTGWL